MAELKKGVVKGQVTTKEGNPVTTKNGKPVMIKNIAVNAIGEKLIDETQFHGKEK